MNLIATGRMIKKAQEEPNEEAAEEAGRPDTPDTIGGTGLTREQLVDLLVRAQAGRGSGKGPPGAGPMGGRQMGLPVTGMPGYMVPGRRGRLAGDLPPDIKSELARELVGGAV